MGLPERIVPHSQAIDSPEFALAQPFFVSPNWHRRDIDLVFKRRWLFVDHASRIAKPGDFLTYELDKESVIVTRGTGGEIHAFHNSCRHRGARLCSEASGNAKMFMCPNHCWTYGLDGRLKSAPRMPDLDKELYPAVPVWVEEWNGMIFINMSEDKPRPVSEYLRSADVSRYALNRAKVAFERTYVISSNWKVCAETYNECYHCAARHPAFCALVDPLTHIESYDDAPSGEGNQGEADDYLIFTADMRSAFIKPGARTFTMEGDIGCKKPLGNGVDWHEEVAALSWYPQFGMYIFPDHAYASSWKPVAPDKSLFRTVWMVHEDAVEGEDYEVSKLIGLVDLINDEDTEVCATAQRGIESAGYRPGPYHPVFEGPLREFNKVYLSQVGTDPYPNPA